MDNQILTTTFDYIEHDQLEELQTYIVEILSQSFEDYRLPWEFIFQRCYLHACLKKNRRIASWFENEVYTYFDDLTKIGLRQSFAYGRYLLNR